MSTTLRLRILVDTEGENNIFRDIEMPSNSTFEELHLAIQEHFNFDNSQMASFYESDDSWERGDEIMLMDMSMDEKQVIRLMRDTVLENVLKEAGQKMLYIFDFLLMWTFFVEVVSVGEFSGDTEYPNVLLSVGDAPDQNSKSAEDLFGAMKSEMMPDMDNEDDPYGDLDLDDNFPSY
jgi:hypothetical protein